MIVQRYTPMSKSKVQGTHDAENMCLAGELSIYLMNYFFTNFNTLHLILPIDIVKNRHYIWEFYVYFENIWMAYHFGIKTIQWRCCNYDSDNNWGTLPLIPWKKKNLRV